MAKKKRVKPMPSTQEPPSKTFHPVRVDFGLSDYAKLVQHSKKRRISMSAFIRMVMAEWLEQQEGKD